MEIKLTDLIKENIVFPSRKWTRIFYEWNSYPEKSLNYTSKASFESLSSKLTYLRVCFYKECFERERGFF